MGWAVIGDGAKFEKFKMFEKLEKFTVVIVEVVSQGKTPDVRESFDSRKGAKTQREYQTSQTFPTF